MTEHVPHISDQEFKKLEALFSSLRAKQHAGVAANLEHNLPTVLIIGAGLSGFAAAQELLNRGFKVKILEARDRIGGRIHSKALDHGAYVEFGAQFLHGLKGNPLTYELEKYQVELKSIAREHCSVFDESGHLVPFEDILPLIKENQEKILSLAQARQQDHQDRFNALALKDVVAQLRSSGAEHKGSLSRVAHELSLGELEEISLFAYKLGLGKKVSDQNYLVTSGFIHFIEGLQKDVKHPELLEVELNAIVEKVEHRSNSVTVTTRNGQRYEADAVICTVPLGVLQQGTVRFVPALPEQKTQSINKLKMANHNKVILEFEHAFWDTSSHYVIPYNPESNSWMDIVNLHYFSDEAVPVLVASIHKDMDQAPKSDKEEIDIVLDVLKKIFKQHIKPLKRAFVTHWDVDPFAYGAYCYHPQGASLDDNTEIARPIGRLCFAGEHTQRNPSNIYGAYLSGYEAAKQVVQQLSSLLELAG